MKFGKINNIVVLGGSYISLMFLKYLKKRKIKFHFFSNQRQLNDLMPNSQSLKKNLIKNKIKFTNTPNLNVNKKIKNVFNKNSLAIGFGEPWKIKSKLLNLFKDRIVTFMGIPLPFYRGGAHYSWMILNNDFKGGCYIQNIDKNTLQGVSDSGYYYLGQNYNYPKNLKNPNDFFKFSVVKEISFLKKFLKVLNKKNFKLKKIDSSNSILFPRLKSSTNGYIDWNLDADEINRFINAFSDPYPGAITFFKNKKIFLKNSKLLKKNYFHSFTSGLIVNKYREKTHISAKNGILLVDQVLNSKKESICKLIKVGDRFETNNKFVNLSKKLKKKL